MIKRSSRGFVLEVSVSSSHLGSRVTERLLHKAKTDPVPNKERSERVSKVVNTQPGTLGMFSQSYPDAPRRFNRSFEGMGLRKHPWRGVRSTSQNSEGLIIAAKSPCVRFVRSCVDRVEAGLAGAEGRSPPSEARGSRSAERQSRR